jgi:hypothetical protein
MTEEILKAARQVVNDGGLNNPRISTTDEPVGEGEEA